jgi:hypothetical protein
MGDQPANPRYAERRGEPYTESSVDDWVEGYSDMCGSVEPHLAAMCALTRHSGNRHQGPEGEWQTWTS